MLKFIFGSVREWELPRESLAYLLLRIFAGAGMMIHGFKKIQNPFGWMGDTSATPEIFQALAALSEFGGGLALILGLLVPLSALGILATMVVAAFVHVQKGDGFVQGWELAAFYATVALFFLLAGPGRWSLDAKIRSRLGT